MAERDELRDYRYSEGEIRSSDWLKGFGPVGCDAEGIASRVGPFVVERADIAALIASGMPEPTEADWLAWLIAVCDDELRLTSSAVGTPGGRSESEARDLWTRPGATAADGFSFASANTLKPVRDVIALAAMFYPLFNQCPKPEQIQGLSADKAEAILQNVRSWASQQWKKGPGVAPPVIETPSEIDVADDYSYAIWKGERFDFGPVQSKCFKVLYQAWCNGKPDLRQQFVLDEAGSDSRTLKLLFSKGKHPAWGKLVIPIGEARGARVKLAPPTPSQTKSSAAQ